MKLSEYVDELTRAGEDQEKKNLATEGMLHMIAADAMAKANTEAILAKTVRENESKPHIALIQTLNYLVGVMVGLFALAGMAFAVKWLMQILGVI